MNPATDDRWLWVATWRPAPLRALAHLLSHGWTLDRALAAPRAEWRGALLAVGSREASAASIEEAFAHRPEPSWFRETRDSIERLGARAVTWADLDYPAQLRSLIDPPPVLFVIGSLAEPGRSRWPDPCASVVGSRRASPSGIEIAAWIAGGLAARGVCVVSGLARGIDAAAHRGALSAGGATIAVLGSGFDRLYPPEHAALAREVSASGTLVTEFTPETPARSEFFPRRNRIIAGLSRATVVVEAEPRSGALVTARLAMEQGREVLAVPRDPLQAGCEGPNALLADGAAPARSADDVCAAIGLTAAPAGPTAAPAGRAEKAAERFAEPSRRDAAGAGGGSAAGGGSDAREGLGLETSRRSVLEARVLGALDGRPRSLDEIAPRVAGAKPPELLAVLAALEVEGAVERTPGPRFRKPAARGRRAAAG